MKKFEELYDFIGRAIKNKKYPENTGLGLKAALKLFEQELSDEEKNSIDVFKSNFEHIYQRVSSKNSGKNYSDGSLNTYKYRVLKILEDYQRYGLDTTKMSGWFPKIVKRTRKNQSVLSVSKQNNDENFSDQSKPFVTENMHKIELALRSDTKFIIIVPRDITSAECITVKTILESLVSEKK